MAEAGPHMVFEVAGGEFGGKLLVTRKAGREVRAALEEALSGLPEGGVLYVDTRSAELMDYSFADEALGIMASRVAGGEYGGRRLVLVEEDRDLLENVEASLRQRSLAMILVNEIGAELRSRRGNAGAPGRDPADHTGGRVHHQRGPRQKARSQPYSLQQPGDQAREARSDPP